MDMLSREAFLHGRTQGRLAEAVESLRRIAALCRSGRGCRYRLLEIETDACLTLERLSKSTGGVIDDMEPLTPKVVDAE
jgi:hypothetical protein